MNEWRQFPFGDTIQEGLRDLERHGEQAGTIPALIVSIGAPKLEFLGIRVPAAIRDPERKLYDLIERNNSDRPDGGSAVADKDVRGAIVRNPHSFYNSLVRRLVSFEHACAVSRQ